MTQEYDHTDATPEPSATLRLRVRPGCSHGPAGILPAGTEFDGTPDELRAFGDKLELVAQPPLPIIEPEPEPEPQEQPARKPRRTPRK